MLECSDVFCFNCIQCHVEDLDVNRQVKCPKCPRYCNVPERMNKNTREVKNEPGCYVCANTAGKIELAEWECLTCEQLLCETDYLEHYRQVGNNLHVVVSVEVSSNFRDIINRGQILNQDKSCDIETMFTKDCHVVQYKIMNRYVTLQKQLNKEKDDLVSVVSKIRACAKETLKEAKQKLHQSWNVSKFRRI